MKNFDDYDDFNKNKTITAACIISICVIVCTIVFVLLANSKKLSKKVSETSVSEKIASVEEILDFDSKDSNTSVSIEPGLTVSDLDFYDMYQETTETEDETPPESLEPAKPETEEPLEESFETDGNHTLVTHADGTSEWVALSPYITKNDYDYNNLLNSNGKLKYFEENKLVSSFGVDISKDQDYIDFNKLKKAGADFVMIRVASRGYQTGNIVEDDYFKDNLKRANDAGLDVGLIFISSAVTEEEAVEEANYVITNIGSYSVTYPIAFVMQYQKNDSSRIDSLSKADKTGIARAFLGTIKQYNFLPILYGDKEWLFDEVDLAKIVSDYDIWYSNTSSDVPDYPYKFTMWQYNSMGSIDGISGYVNFDICFVDYSMR